MSIREKKARKPRKWRKSDADLCIGCAKAFKRGDMIYTNGIISIHDRAECKKEYLKDCKESGIDP